MGDYYIKAPDFETAIEVAYELGLLVDGQLIGDPVVDNPIYFIARPETFDSPSIPSPKSIKNRVDYE